MGWWIAVTLFFLVAGLVVLASISCDRAARRGWQQWNEQRRSGALAWTLFRRRANLPRLTDRRDQ